MDRGSYWTCTQCTQLNVFSLTMCARCDAVRTSAAPSPVRLPAAPTAASVHAATPSSGRAFSPSRMSPSRHGPGPFASNPSFTTSHQATHQITSPRVFGAATASPTPSPNSSFRTGPVSAAISAAALHEHQYSSIAQQHQRQKEFHHIEVSELRQQLDSAVQTHRNLLTEYQLLSKEHAARKTEVMLLTAEVTSLRERLQVEAARRTEVAQHLAEENDAMRQSLKQLREQLQTSYVANVSPTPSHGPKPPHGAGSDRSSSQQAQLLGQTPVRKASDLGDVDSVLSRHQSASLSQLPPPRSPAVGPPAVDTSAMQSILQLKDHEIAVLQARVATLESNERDAAGVIVKLTNELEAERKAATDSRYRFTEDTQRMLKDTLANNEVALAALVEDLNRSRQQSEQRHAEERGRLETSLRDAKAELIAAQQLHQRENDRATDQIAGLMQAVQRNEKQREELAYEKQHQLEIISELQAEKAALTAELTTLRVALQSGRLVVAPAPSLRTPGPNTSHHVDTSPRAGDASSLHTEVQSMQRSVDASTTSQRLSATPPPNDDSGSSVELQHWRQRCLKLENTVADLEALVAKQREETADAHSRLALSHERLEAEEKAREQLEARLNAGQTEEEEELQAKTTFELAELRKQLGNTKESLRNRDDDLLEAQQNVDYLTAQIEVLREGFDNDAKQLKDSVQQWKTTAENLSKQVNELTKANATLVEARDNATSVVADHERALADALAALVAP